MVRTIAEHICQLFSSFAWRPCFCLFHCDFVDLTQRLSAGSSFDSFDGDFLNLFFRLLDLRLELCYLGSLAYAGIFQRLNLKLGDSFLGVAVFLQQRHLLFESLFCAL